MNHQMNKYRLRLNSRIIGYAEETEEGLLFKGREPLWWMRGKPNYNQIDRFVGFQDKFHRDIYEYDLVNYRLNVEQGYSKGVVLSDGEENRFGILDLERKHFTLLYFDSICLFQTEKMEIYSHLFNHPDLEELILK